MKKRADPRKIKREEHKQKLSKLQERVDNFGEDEADKEVSKFEELPLSEATIEGLKIHIMSPVPMFRSGPSLPLCKATICLEQRVPEVVRLWRFWCLCWSACFETSGVMWMV